MKSLCQFEEYGKGMGFPSIKSMFSAEPYYGKEKVVEYLKNGRKTFSATSVPYDFFTGDRIPIEKCGMTDGEYSWMSSLYYYVEKYNLKMPADFMKKVIG
ncbi:MAG: hypothetical protein Q4B85_06630 [Lachnospiraceae bacterium]|nr:hypothetical protein [Lachnospiraceae bacterium]